MPLLSKTFLRKVADEGVSANGSEGTGGHAQGFDIVNGGVTRRRPGEGPKVNGGRSQSQEMDSMDQPQYEGPEERFTVGPENNEEVCPICNGEGGCEYCNLTGTFEGYLQTFDEEFPPENMTEPDSMWNEKEPVDEEAPFAGMKDPEGWDRQVATGTNTRDQGVRDDVSLKEMFGVEEGPINNMRRAVDKMDRTKERLKKSSEKEKKEHPWASAKVATQIAKDHEKLGEQLKRTIVIKESPDVLKPGDCYMATQFMQLDGANCNDPKLRGAGYKCNPVEAPLKGYVKYTVKPDGTLETTSANWDSGD